MKSKRGRPTLYKAEYVEQARKLCLLGATDRELADFFHVSEQTLNTWKAQHSEFLESLKVGKSEADQRVERSLYQRALGYSHPDVHISNYQGAVTITPITKHYPPETVAGIFWLKNRKPEEWRDRIEHTGKDGGPIETKDLSESDLAREVAFLLTSAVKQQTVQ